MKIKYSLVQGDQPPEPAWSPKTRFGGELRVVYSQKMQREVNLLFDLEYFHWIFLELDPLVRWFCEHPLKRDVEIEGRTVTTLFDMWILYTNSRELLREIKPKKRVDDGSNARQHAAQTFWCRLAGMDHELITNTRLCRQPLLDNCRRIYPYLAQKPGVAYEHRVLTMVDHQVVCSLKDLHGESHLETQKMWHAAFHLLCRGILLAPLATQPFDKLTFERATDDEPRHPLC